MIIEGIEFYSNAISGASVSRWVARILFGKNAEYEMATEMGRGAMNGRP